MHVPTRIAAALAVLVLVSSLAALGVASAGMQTPPVGEDLRALDGEWLYVEDRTEGREIEKQQPPMSVTFALRVEDGAVVLVRGKGTGRREIRMALDGSPTEVPGVSSSAYSRYVGAWKDGAFTYDIQQMRTSDKTQTGLLRFEMRPTGEGLLVRVAIDPPTGMQSLALYRHPADIAMPTPKKAVIGDLAWLAGAWVGTRGTNGATSIEERWGPPLGGAMLAVSRTVKGEKMVAFEYLRIVQRDGGLVYIAQPNGASPTEFVLSDFGATRAVFENPRHDSPQRIVYELSAEGGLSASIGFMKGGRPQRFEFKREGS